jgi:hypothetical protein
MADLSMVRSHGSLPGEGILKLSGASTLSTVVDFQDAMRANRTIYATFAAAEAALGWKAASA